MAENHKTPEAFAITEWGQLSDDTTVTVHVEDLDRTVSVVMRVPDAMDVLQIEMDEPMPDPPLVVDRNGLPRRNDNDPTYIKETRSVAIRRDERRVALTLVTPPIPGETFEEQSKALRDLPAHIYNALRDLASQLCYSRSARVEERGEKFQQKRAAHNGNSGAASPDAE
jgi:hypothetical protein